MAPGHAQLVVGRPTLREVTDQSSADLVELVDPGYCVLDGIESVLKSAKPAGRVVVLLGDVVWSRDALAKTIADRRSLYFVGTPDVSPSKGELFAVGCGAGPDLDAMLELLKTCPCRVDGRGLRRRMFPRAQGGHLRRLLWWAQDRRRLRPNNPVTWVPELYIPVDDFTDDIDTEADVEGIGTLTTWVRSDDMLAQIAR
jgi:hypothetical protein